MYNFALYFLIFLTFSVFGWSIETIKCSIEAKKRVERGFLVGPYCPIYGWGGLLVYLLLDQYKSNPLTLFILAVVVCSVVEYITSYVMEKLFKARWWDYSHEKFNINGRVFLGNSVLFGLGGIIVVYFIFPNLMHLYKMINETTLIIGASILLFLFIADTIISTITVYKLRNNFKHFCLDATMEIKNIIKKSLGMKVKMPPFHKLGNRLLEAFPKFEPLDFKKKKK